MSARADGLRQGRDAQSLRLAEILHAVQESIVGMDEPTSYRVVNQQRLTNRIDRDKKGDKSDAAVAKNFSLSAVHLA